MDTYINTPLNGYICFYNGRKAEIRAASLYAAKLAAIEHFSPPRSKQHMVSVMLAEKGDAPGVPVTHTPDF